MWDTLQRLLGGGTLPAAMEAQARAVATLPGRLGGLGLQDARRTAPSAYWAAWADALPLLTTRQPNIAEAIVRHLQNNESHAPSLTALREAADFLAAEGFQAPI